MSFALIGLTAFQVYWINNALDLNRKAFHENAMSSLRRVVNDLERRETIQATSTSISAFFSDSTSFQNKDFIYKNEDFNTNGKEYVLIEDDTILLSKENLELVALPESKKKITQEGAENQPVKLRLEKDSFTVSIDAQRKFISKRSMVNVVMEQLVNPNEINERISEPLVDSLLNIALTENGIEIVFEFIIWDSSKDSVVMSYEKTDAELIKQSEFRAALFPGDLIANSNFLVLNFPGATTYLYRQIWMTLAASILFIGIIVSCFSYAILIIFRQKKLSEMKNDFINNMTHELKTPIATVGLAVEALNEKEMRNNENTVLRYLSMIQEENLRLSDHVEKVLQSAILDKESFELKYEKLNLHQTINSAMDKTVMQLEDRAGTVINLLDAENDKIEGDEFHLTNVFLNVIDNAIKYSKDKPLVQIKSYNSNGFICIEILDEGIGMSKGTVNQIFDKFYRVPTGNRHDVKGFGLGLSYVKTIVEKHGGTIEVSSELGKGSNFIIKLPND